MTVATRLLDMSLAGPEDDADLRRLLRDTPVPGMVTLRYEREPDYFTAAALEGDLHQVLIGRQEGQVAGLGSRAVRDAWVMGRPARLGYLGQLRVQAGLRGRKGLLEAGYAALRELHAGGETPFYLSTIVASNRPARRLLEAGLPGFPTYRPFDTLVTMVLPATRSAPPRLERGQSIEEICDFLQTCHAPLQFAPRWTPATLIDHPGSRGLRPSDFILKREGGRLVGCLALWDQRAFKQHVVAGYAPPLAHGRALWNMLGLPQLPPPGQPVDAAFISHVAITPGHTAVFSDLLAEARREAAWRRLAFVYLGLPARSPLRRLVPMRHFAYDSILYLVYWPDGEAAACALDRRLTGVEVALL